MKLYPARFESLENLREFVGQTASEFGLDERSVYAVQMAVDEAFTNVVEHAYGGESDEEIQVTCWYDTDKLTIVLRDCGRPFNPDSVPAPNLEAELEEREVGGLGLYFMRQLMDEVEFAFEDTGENRCNVLKMVKHKG